MFIDESTKMHYDDIYRNCRTCYALDINANQSERKNRMPGTRTASVVDATPDYKVVSLQWIDADGDSRGDSIAVPTSATEVQIEAVAAKMVLASNASLWRVVVGNVFEGAKSKSNALEAVRESAQDNIVFHAKNGLRVSTRVYVPAPLAAVFVTDTETPDASSTELDEMMTAVLALLAGTFAGVSLRFTERREIGEKVNL